MHLACLGARLVDEGVEAEERTKGCLVGSDIYAIHRIYMCLPMLFGNNGISTCGYTGYTATRITSSRAGLRAPHPSFVLCFSSPLAPRALQGPLATPDHDLTETDCRTLQVQRGADAPAGAGAYCVSPHALAASFPREVPVSQTAGT